LPARGTATRSDARAAAAHGATARELERLHAALASDEPRAHVEIGGHEIRLTHLDRVYWPAVPALDQPAITKRMYLRYLVAVAPLLLPHAVDRPLTLFRWPEGLGTRRVRQKHWEIPLPPFVERVDVFSDSKGHADPYILCNNLATLVWLGHMGTLELHVWHSRVRPGPDSPVTSTAFAASSASLRASILEFPDYILFDIDPFIYSGGEEQGKDPELCEPAFAQVRQAALWLKDLLDDMSLESLVKTSGKTGLHVIVPIRRTLAYDAVREVARFVGEHLAQAHRDEITTEWTVQRRRGKVFLDYNMNVRAKSMPLPYSARGVPGAPVSMPLTWRQLHDAYPLDFRITTVPPTLRRRSDPWRGWLADKQSLEARLARARPAPA
jgi:bifunctional non-homologous end joining protein LigD